MTRMTVRLRVLAGWVVLGRLWEGQHRRLRIARWACRRWPLMGCHGENSEGHSREARSMALYTTRNSELQRHASNRRPAVRHPSRVCPVRLGSTSLH
jgi:hypothetical protein